MNNDHSPTIREVMEKLIEKKDDSPTPWQSQTLFSSPALHPTSRTTTFSKSFVNTPTLSNIKSFNQFEPDIDLKIHNPPEIGSPKTPTKIDTLLEKKTISEFPSNISTTSSESDLSITLDWESDLPID